MKNWENTLINVLMGIGVLLTIAGYLVQKEEDQKTFRKELFTIQYYSQIRDCKLQFNTCLQTPVPDQAHANYVVKFCGKQVQACAVEVYQQLAININDTENTNAAIQIPLRQLPNGNNPLDQSGNTNPPL